MADNVAITAGAGTNVATDDIGGVQYQRVKVTHGADGSATDASAATPLPVGAGYVEASGTASAVNTDVVNLDVRGYATVSVYIPQGTFSGTLAFQWSGDAGATWASAWIDQLANSTSLHVRTQSVTGVTIGLGPVLFSGAVRTGRFRVRCSAYTSGTATAYVIATAASPVDTRPNITSAVGGSGLQIPPAGVLGKDSGTSLYQPMKVLADGTVVVNQKAITVAPLVAGTGTLSTTAASTTGVQLLAANANRLAFAVYNESTNVLYLSLSVSVSVTGYTVQVPPRSLYERDGPVPYTGVVAGLWDGTGGSARITEWSA